MFSFCDMLSGTPFFQVGSGLVGDDDAFTSGGTISARVESSYIINLRDLGMKHVKDFVFLHGKLPRWLSPPYFVCFEFSLLQLQARLQ